MKRKPTIDSKNSYGSPQIISLSDYATTNDEKAILTHWLHNIGTSSAKNYADKAKQLLPTHIREFFDNKLFAVNENGGQQMVFKELLDIPFSQPQNPKFTFVDLFAGIGGFRIAMQNCGGKCVFSSEWNQAAQETYFTNFGEVPFGDITKQEIKDCIPDNFDILCAGFPCQAFSIAGYRKGFEDIRGTLFFDVVDILHKKRPKAFYLENVKNLCSHDNGNTFKTIMRVLEKDLKYKVFHVIMNPIESANVPQNRERIFIVGFDPEQVTNYNTFVFPEKIPLTKTIHDCIDNSTASEPLFYRESSRYYPQLKDAMKNKDTVYQWRRQYVRENKSNVCPTLTANMGAGGHNVPLIITKDGFRKLSPRECLNFQGFPAEYKFPPIAMSKCYMQAGNSVTVPLIQRVTNQILKVIENG